MTHDPLRGVTPKAPWSWPMPGFRHLVPSWGKLGCEWPRHLEGYLPYHLTVSLHLHRELAQIGLVGLLKRVNNLNSVCSCGPVIGELNAFGNLEMVAVAKAEVIDRHESDLRLPLKSTEPQHANSASTLSVPVSIPDCPKQRGNTRNISRPLRLQPESR